MRYEKPIVVDLGGRAASGANPLACLTGAVVTGPACHAGDGDAACYGGTGGTQISGECVGGATPSGSTSCLAGTTASWECASGGSPAAGHGPCTSGPTP